MSKVAVTEPSNLFLIDELRSVTSKEIQIVVATSKDIRRMISTLPDAKVFVILRHSLKHGAPAAQVSWEGAKGLEWTVPSPAPYHTFETPPDITPSMLAHGDITDAAH